MRTLVVSLSIVLLLALSTGYVLKDFIGFWEGVVAAIIIQFLSSYIFLSKTKYVKKVEENELLANEIISMQTVPVACPCGGNTFEAMVLFNEENMFLCDKCGSKFRVEVNYESVLVTEPVNLEKAFNALKNKELS